MDRNQNGSRARMRQITQGPTMSNYGVTGIVRELDSPHNFSGGILKSPHVPMYSFPNLKPPQLTPLVLDQDPNRDFCHVGATSKARRSQF